MNETIHAVHVNLINQAESKKKDGKTGQKKFPDALTNEALSNDPLLMNDSSTEDSVTSLCG